MAASDSQSFSEAASLGRSSSMDAREGLPRSDSQRRSGSGSSKLGRKGHRSGNDLFVCFAPRTTLNLVSANRPVLSPARDKSKDKNRSGRNSSIFSSKSNGSSAPLPVNTGSSSSKKQSSSYGEAPEEPTSPKVTCIGQVRSKSKQKKKKAMENGGASLRKGASGREEPPPSRSACPGFGKDFSCFGLPCDSYSSVPSFRGDKKSSGTVLAKSLVYMQDEEDKTQSSAVATSSRKGGHNTLSCNEEASQKKMPPSLPPTTKAQSQAQATSLSETASSSRELVQPATLTQVSETKPSITKKEISAQEVSSVASFDRNSSSKDQTDVEEDDTFETEPPPPNALLLMRSKMEHLRVVVPPPSVNITLKRSTSAPVHSRKGDEPIAAEPEVGSAKELDGSGDHLSKLGFDSRKDVHYVLASEQPKSAAKSFLQRCKSVSQSLTRSNSMQIAVNSVQSTAPAPVLATATNTSATNDTIEPAKKSVSQETGQTAQEAAATRDEKNDQLYLVSEAVSRRRSDSEALKVSLDVVPETWLREAWTSARQQQQQQAKETVTGSSGRRQDLKQIGGASAAEWLDAELEASLWKSCGVDRRKDSSTGGHVPGVSPMVDEADSAAEQCLDAEVEATLWRSCTVVSSQLPEAPTSGPGLSSKPVDLDSQSLDAGNVSRPLEQKGSRSKSSSGFSFGRSSSVGTQRGKQYPESSSMFRRSASVGAGKQFSQERQMGTKGHLGIPVPVDIDNNLSKTTSIREESDHISSNRASNTCSTMDSEPVESRSSSDNPEENGIVGERDTTTYFLPSQEARSEQIYSPDDDQGTDRETDAMGGAPSPSSVLDRPAPPPSPAPATPPEGAVLFVRYDHLGTFRISVQDASATMIDTVADDQQKQHQKAMLEAISQLHIQGVQGYTRLLKAASGKEQASLSTAALRLQRCKSEPVRLASY